MPIFLTDLLEIRISKTEKRIYETHYLLPYLYRLGLLKLLNQIAMKRAALICLLIPMFGIAQEKKAHDPESGYFMLGVRNTISTFSDDGATGMGFGAQFRIRVTKGMNTDQFADYFVTNIGGLARRVDEHWGWSVLAYPFNTSTTAGKITPYVLAGHCFDYSKVSKNGADAMSKSKFSSAVQAGLGAHYNFTDRMDISLTAQYMMHLGYDIHTNIVDVDGKRDVIITKEKVSGIEGHLLINVSLNVRLVDLWK